MLFVRGYSLSRTTVQAGGKPGDVEAGADNNQKDGVPTTVEVVPPRGSTEKPSPDAARSLSENAEDAATTVGESDIKGKENGSEAQLTSR